jgi:hypothetical protein
LNFSDFSTNFDEFLKFEVNYGIENNSKIR